MTIRHYDHDLDFENVMRIFHEVGWLTHEKEKEKFFEAYIRATHGFVAELNGTAECSVRTYSGSMRYQDGELPFMAVGSVVTSRIARRRGLASRTTAIALADAVQRGAVVAGLGMFDQGYYDQLGFGTMPYDRVITFDPATLSVPGKASIPQRFSVNDAKLLHRGRLNRFRPHGGVAFSQTEFTRFSMVDAENGFGLGYTDGDHVSHHFWAEAKGENGPYHIWWLVYENTNQMMELFSLLRDMSDQVHYVTMQEPPQIQIQDILDQPLRNRARTRRSENENGMESSAISQIRILDLPACIEALQAHEEIEFNLKLRDPLEELLPEGSWRGTSGEYIIRIGKSSSAEIGHDSQLPTLNSNIGAFSRIWLGVRSASSIALTDDVDGPTELLKRLDTAVLLPIPNFDWSF